MDDKVLVKSELAGLLTLLKGKLQGKETGKGLSTNDFTTALKNKLDGIYAGAEVNKIDEIQIDSVALQIQDKIVNIDLSGYAKKSDIATIYKYKGSCTYAELIAKADAAVGDVWNVTDKGGTNYACITAATAGADAWDPLGMVIDLTEYLKKSEASSTYAAKTHSHEISNVNGLQDALDAKTSSDDVNDILNEELVAMTASDIEEVFASVFGE